MPALPAAIVAVAAVAALATAAAPALSGDAFAQDAPPEPGSSLGTLIVNLVAPSTYSTTSTLMATIIVPTTTPPPPDEAAPPTVVATPAPFLGSGSGGGGGGGGGGGSRIITDGTGGVVLYAASWDCDEGTISVTTNAGIRPEVTIVSSSGTVAAQMGGGPHPAGRAVYEAPLPDDPVVSIRAMFADGRTLSTASETVRTGGQCAGEAVFRTYADPADGQSLKQPMQEQDPSEAPAAPPAAGQPDAEADMDSQPGAGQEQPMQPPASAGPDEEDAAPPPPPRPDPEADRPDAPSEEEGEDDQPPAMQDDSEQAPGAGQDEAAADGDDGGCLIATAAYGTEIAPQVQSLREIRDSTLLTTESGRAFMSAFGAAYYAFSPQVADMERDHPAFRQAVAVLVAPMLYALQVVDAAEPGSEAGVAAYGALAISLVAGMYVAAPAAGAWYAVRLGRRLRASA